MNQPPSSIAEHHVQFAFRHCLRFGDTVYDVGANRGWLSVPLSRLVGPTGYTACFEASPRNIGILSDTFRKYHLVNAELIGAAVFQETGKVVSLFENSFSNTDSIYFSDGSGTKVDVPTVTLDDFSTSRGLRPSFIKMDIEGAEYDALVGAERLIQDCHPTFVLEMRPADLRPYYFLLERGYKAINLKDFSAVETADDVDTGAMVEDILFVHPSHPRGYLPAPSLAEAPFKVVSAAVEADGCATLVRKVPVTPGINCFRLHCRSEQKPTIEFHALSGPRCVVQFRGTYGLVCVPHLSFIVHAEAAGEIDLCIESIGQDMPVEIERIERRVVTLSPAGQGHHALLNVLSPFGLGVESLSDPMNSAFEGNRLAQFELFKEHLIQGEPNHPRLTYLSGVSALRQGKLDEAAGLLDRAAALGFDRHWVNYMRAVALHQLGNTEAAIEAARTAQAANGGNAGLNELLARLEASKE